MEFYLIYLEKGLNYPTSLNKALDSNIDTPNDILGICYIKSILKNNYDIKPITIKRTSNYHDIKSNNSVISASNIREKIKNNIDITKYVPTKEYINNINYDLLFTLLKYKILTTPDLSIYLTVDEGIENKIKKEINNVNSIEKLTLKIKSKRYTYNRIRRMLIHILIGLKKEDAKTKLSYIKLLGFNNIGKKYINRLKKETNIPILTKITEENIIRKYELIASSIYEIITKENTNTFEYKNKPIIK